MNNLELTEFGKRLEKYCIKFNIPFQHLFEILEDQKVVPMIRGKAMEFNASIILSATLPTNVWSVDKLNLNAQNNQYDEDVSITHKKTGIILKVESKSGVRGSFTSGKRTREYKNLPHFKVKCHRSRSNISLVGSSNDKYSVESFDVLISNPTNSLFEGNTIGEDFELIKDKEAIKYLYDFYNVNNQTDLVLACEKDWRFVIPTDIAIDGYIPRTPYVLHQNDTNWKPLSHLEERLLEIVKEKHEKNTKDRRSKK